MQSTNEEWARSYARQALSDLDAREALRRANTEKCHRLHFLQMAAEKTCKAYLVKLNGHDNVKKSHAVVKKHLHIIARQFYSALGGNPRTAHWGISAINRLAGEIEVLSPACDHGGSRSDNCEYPWEDGLGQVCTPCEYSFPNIDDGPRNRSIARLIRLIRTAAESYSGQ